MTERYSKGYFFEKTMQVTFIMQKNTDKYLQFSQIPTNSIKASYTTNDFPKGLQKKKKE